MDIQPQPVAPQPLLREAATASRPLLRQETSTVAEAMVDRPQGKPPFNEISVLFPLLTFYTVAYMGLMAAEFLLRGSFVLPTGLMTIYIALTGAYAADKEIRRWAGAPEPPRKGSVFVYIWLLFYLVAFMIRAFRPDFALPGELNLVALQVLAIFFGSRASKYIHERRPAAALDPAELSVRQNRILALIQERGKATRADVMTTLGLGKTAAFELLEEMVQAGLIQRAGEGRGTYYITAEKTSVSDRT